MSRVTVAVTAPRRRPAVEKVATFGKEVLQRHVLGDRIGDSGCPMTASASINGTLDEHELAVEQFFVGIDRDSDEELLEGKG